MRILFVNTRPPWPGRRGDQARTVGLVECLKDRHEICVLAQRWPGTPVARPPAGVRLETVSVSRAAVATRLALGVGRAFVGGRRPFQNGFFDHASFRVALRRRVAEFRPDVVVLVLGRLGHLLDDLDLVAGDVPVVVDLVDALSLNFAQRARRERLLAWLWRWESRRLARWDASLASRAAAVTVVAERDRTALVEGAPVVLQEVVADRCHVVPFGLLSACSTTDSTSTDPAETEGEPVVALTGNLGYFPTVDGALHFARHAWPEVRRRVPDARWLLAGSRPTRSIRALAALPGIELVADPEDLEALAATARVAIAPMRSGSGTPIKILEAMSWGLPVVATSHAAAGLDELPADALAVADDGLEFARRVSELLVDPERARRATVSAARWLLRRHALDASASRFEQILESVARRPVRRALG